MAPDASEEVTVREGGAKSGSQFDQNPTGGTGDYSASGDYGAAKYKMNRGDRDPYDRRDYKREGERRPSMDRVRMNFDEEGPYGRRQSPFESNRFDYRDRQFGYGPDRPYGHGRMGHMSPIGSPYHFGYGGDFDRYNYRPEFAGRLAYGSESARSDYGRSPYSRGGYRDYYGRYGPQRGFGREYGYRNGYGARHGEEHGGRMDPYGYTHQQGSDRGSQVGSSSHAGIYGRGYANRSYGYGEQSQRGSTHRPGYGSYGGDYGKVSEKVKNYDYGKDCRDQSPYGYSKYGYGDSKPRGYSQDSVVSYNQSQRSASPYDSSKYNRNSIGQGEDRKEAEPRKNHREASPVQSVSGRSTYESSPYRYGSSTYGQGYNSSGMGPYNPRSYERSSYGRFPFDSARFSDGGRERSGGYGGKVGHRAQYGSGGRQRDYSRDYPRFGGCYGGGYPFKGNQFGGYGGDFLGPPPPFDSFQQYRSPPPSPFVEDNNSLVKIMGTNALDEKKHMLLELNKQSR